LPTGVVFQQDGMPAHTACSTQKWLQADGLDFIRKDQWPANSLNINPMMDYHMQSAMLEAYHKLKTKLKTIA